MFISVTEKNKEDKYEDRLIILMLSIFIFMICIITYTFIDFYIDYQCTKMPDDEFYSSLKCTKYRPYRENHKQNTQR